MNWLVFTLNHIKVSWILPFVGTTPQSFRQKFRFSLKDSDKAGNTDVWRYLCKKRSGWGLSMSQSNNRKPIWGKGGSGPEPILFRFRSTVLCWVLEFNSLTHSDLIRFLWNTGNLKRLRLQEFFKFSNLPPTLLLAPLGMIFFLVLCNYNFSLFLRSYIILRQRCRDQMSEVLVETTWLVEGAQNRTQRSRLHFVLDFFKSVFYEPWSRCQSLSFSWLIIASINATRCFCKNKKWSDNFPSIV